MLGVLWGKQELLGRMKPYRVETNKDAIPYKYEQGMLNNAALASLGAALQYLLWLDGELHPSSGLEKEKRRARLERVMSAIQGYEAEISRRVLERLGKLKRTRFRLYGLSDPGQVAQRDPTFAFEIADQKAAETKKFLWERHGLQIADGNHYAAVFHRHYRRDSVCRASFAHYNSLDEVNALAEALEDLMSDKKRKEDV